MASASPSRTFRHAAPSAPDAFPVRDATDRLDYDSWLLPPVELDGAGRFVRAMSIAVGPAALCAFAGAVALLIA